MGDVVISVKGIGKKYKVACTRDTKHGIGRIFRMEDHPVLEDMDMEIEHGEIVAVIGRNGSGKTTFMKLLAGILEPDSGRIEVRGRCAEIIDLSMGFHNEFTGRENIFMRCELYGMERDEIESHVDDIVSFADIGDFIDRPMQTYSSGMRSRLAFAIMMHVNADVYIVDAPMQTGDSSFSSKTSEHMRNLIGKGKTVVIATHSMRFARDCSRAIWIDDGKVAMDGDPEDVCDAYVRSTEDSLDETVKLAEDGSAAAQYRLAGFYRDGIHVEKDRGQYAHWLEQAAERGDTKAAEEFADLLMSEDPVNNRKRAMGFYEVASKRSFSACRMYAMLRSECDDEIMMLRDVLGKLAGTGFPYDLCAYAQVMEETAMSDEDRRTALEYYLEAADAGSAEGMYRAGMMVLNGEGTERSADRAVDLLERAALLGHPRAMTVLGDSYMSGKILERNHTEAFRWYLLSAETGNVRSQYTVATMLSEGDGVDKDDDEADIWFRRYTLNSQSRSRYQAIDTLRRRGGELKINLLPLMEDAAKGRDLRTALSLAEMRMSGKGAPKDTETGMDLMTLASKGMGRNRTPLAKNMNENSSFDLFKQAADNGDPYAMYTVACMYRDGKGIPEDRDMYKFYTRMAADSGNKDAKEVVNKWDAKEKKRRKRELKENDPPS